MTKDLLRSTAIARALVTLMTNPDHDVSDPAVLAGFDSVVNALGEEVEKAAQAESTRQVEILEAMRAHGADIVQAVDDEARANAMEALAEDFEAFSATIPGHDSSGSRPAVLEGAIPTAQTT